MPMAACDDLSAFKIYLVDVGLLRLLAQLAPAAFGEGNRLFTEFKGEQAPNDNNAAIYKENYSRTIRILR